MAFDVAQSTSVEVLDTWIISHLILKIFYELAFVAGKVAFY